MGTPLIGRAAICPTRGRTDWDPSSQTENIVQCINALGVVGIDDARGGAPRLLLLGCGTGAEGARDCARAVKVADEEAAAVSRADPSAAAD